MARSRNIKPGFFTNDDLAEIDPLGRLLFAGLWTIADREGRLEDRPKRIKAEVLPYDDCDPNCLLQQLATKGFIVRYQALKGDFIQISNWSKHQNPHKNEIESSIPAPDSNTCIVLAPEQNSSNPADSGFRIPDSSPQTTDIRSLAIAKNDNNHSAPPPNAASAATLPECRAVFERYRVAIQPQAKLDAREQIRLRLKKFSVDELMTAIDKFAADKWWMDNNGTRGAPWFFKSDAHIEQFLNLKPRPIEKPKNGRAQIKADQISDDDREYIRRAFGNGVAQ